MKWQFIRSGYFIFIFAVIIASLYFFGNRYNGVTVLLQQKSEQSGIGAVYWDSGSGFNESAKALFTVDTGTRGYCAHLPAANVRAIRIVPVVDGTGPVELFRLSLLSDSMQYTWEKDGTCLQQHVGRGNIVAEACTGDHPVIASDGDSFVSIRNISQNLFDMPLRTRITTSLFVFSLFFCGGLWLRQVNDQQGRPGRLSECVRKISWLLLVFMYGVQFFRVVRYAVDVPYLDEWAYFELNALSPHLDWSWLVAFHNEHRIILTKLMAWLNLKLFGLDFAAQQLANFVQYGALIGFVAYLKRRIIGNAFPAFPLFLVFLLSSLNIENHLWGFQSQFHLVVIFSLLAVSFAFLPENRCRNNYLVAVFILLAAYSFSAGVVMGIILLIMMAVYYGAEFDTKQRRSGTGLSDLLVPAALVVAGLLLWFTHYRRPGNHPALELPFSGVFWDYFLNLVSLGFGILDKSALIGGICFAVVTIPLVVLWIRKVPFQAVARMQITAAVLIILSFLAIISMARSGIDLPKSSRYSEFGMLLIPFTAIAAYLAIPAGRVRGGLLAAFWIACFLTFSPFWSDIYYRIDWINRLVTLECVDNYINRNGSGRCEENIDASLGPNIDRARSLDIMFIRQFNRTGMNAAP